MIFWEIIYRVAIVGLIYWLLGYVPLPEPFKSIINGVLIIGLILWLIKFLM